MMPNPFEVLPLDERQIIHMVSARLRDEFAGVFNVETIERFISDSWRRLHPMTTVTRFLPVLTERFARDRLRALARVEGHLGFDRPAVLFLCVHNAGRSQMAAGWLRRLAGGSVLVWSGGSEPTSEVNPAVVAAMAEVGIDISHEFPKPWTDEVVRAADVVVSMGCGDACPVYPGKRYEDWDLPDPSGLDVAKVRPVRDEIRQRVEHLITTLQRSRPATRL